MSANACVWNAASILLHRLRLESWKKLVIACITFLILSLYFPHKVNDCK